jgi:hypothetical protein
MFNRKKKCLLKSLTINLLKNKTCKTCSTRRGASYCVINPKIESCTKWESLELFLIKYPEYKRVI